MRSYVLDQYKEILFPKQVSKYEKAHAEAMERQRERDQLEQKAVRKKILALADMMQYDDDIEESRVTQSKLNADGQKSSGAVSSVAQPLVTKASEERKESEGEEDEEDFVMDDPLAFIER